ncbi:unnamed protein product [Blepharisma stoltei]|uniref:Uncharacterized protein n=1 Tax=Blepharisma stoltei TaxID=1481888 RepID=A0AAU9IL01_9CILI|nr:unnamed protein product [Blepharisma stoltei]
MSSSHKEFIHFSETSFWLLIGSLMSAFMFGNVFMACTFSISCLKFLPTFSYLGCYRDHDRWLNFSLAFYGGVLPLIVVSLSVKLAEYVKKCSLIIMILAGFMGCTTLILIGLIDEVNGLYILPLDRMHPWLTLFLYGCFNLFLYIALTGLENVPLEYSEKEWLGRCNNLYRLANIMFAVTGTEWFLAYSIYSNFFINEVVEALCEWFVVTLAVFFPFALSNVTNTQITVECKPTKQIEYESIK